MSEVLDQLRAFVVQSAETARMMGVDFLPQYRSGTLDVSGLDLSPTEPAPALIDVKPSLPVPATSLPGFGQPAPGVPPKSKPVPVVTAASAPVRSSARKSSSAPTLIAEAASVLTVLEPVTPAAIAASRTREEAQAAMAALRARYEADAPHKHFKTDHHNIVWGEGDVRASLMFVGEAPGEEEDKTGKPFVGRSGELLTKMIGGMGLTRMQIYIANVLKTRPPGNATPTSTESDLCAPYLIAQIAIVSPQAIVALGLPATKALLRVNETMGAMRGRWSNLKLPDGRDIPVMPTYHPAYVLRSYTDEVRGKVWADLKMAMQRLGLAK